MRRLLLALALAGGAAHADNGPFYIGAGVSTDRVSGIVNGATSFADIDTTAWKLLAGFRPVSVVAIEADYLNLGNPRSSFVIASSHSDANAFAGYAVGFLPILLPFLDIFGKAGLARWRLDGSEDSSVFGPGTFSKSGTEFAWGLGTQVHFGNFGGRLEYEKFAIPSTHGANVVSLTVYLNLN